MPEMTDHDRIVEMHTILLGANGQEGLCRRVDRHGFLLDKHNRNIFKLWLAVVMLGMAIGGGTYSVIEICARALAS